MTMRPAAKSANWRGEPLHQAIAYAALDPAKFQAVIDAEPVALFVLRNAQGMTACITNYGAKIQQLLVPDAAGELTDVVLGYDSIDTVVGGSPSMGAFIGRYAGRIGGSAFTLDGRRYPLTANNGQNCLHGGVRGSRFRVFDALQHNASSVEMNYQFADGEEGFPGTLALRITYSVTEQNELVLDYQATALDQATVASFTTHAFFNLCGAASGDLLDHEVMIDADQTFVMTDELVATGELQAVQGTAFDFRQAMPLSSRIGQTVAGFDACYLVNRPGDDSQKALTRIATVSSPKAKRSMEVWSTEPALQFYTGLQAGEPLAGGLGKGGVRYLQQQSFCLEPQGYPNAPNSENVLAYASSLYLPGQSRAGKTAYRFSCWV